MPAVLAPITPSVLAWALGEAGFTPERLADKVEVDAEVVYVWLSGDAQPSTSDFGRMAKALGRSRSFFFLPSPPSAHRVPVAFRAAPGSSRRDLIPEEASAIRQARRLQRLTRWSREMVAGSPPELPVINNGVMAVPRGGYRSGVARLVRRAPDRGGFGDRCDEGRAKDAGSAWRRRHAAADG